MSSHEIHKNANYSINAQFVLGCEEFSTRYVLVTPDLKGGLAATRLHRGGSPMKTRENPGCSVDVDPPEPKSMCMQRAVYANTRRR